MQAFLLLFVGALTGPVYDAGFFRQLIMAGSFAIIFGHMMLSLCKEFYQALLAQGFVVGIGAGLLFVPSVAILPTYFTTKIPIVIGIAASGSSLGMRPSVCGGVRYRLTYMAGGIIYPIVFERLQKEVGPDSMSINIAMTLQADMLSQIGFPWATRVLGFIMLATLAIPNSFMHPRVLPPAKRKLFDVSAFKNPAYVFFVIALAIGFMGLYVPFFYIQYFAQVKRLTTGDLGGYLLAILNAGSVFGRIFPNFFAQKIGPMNMLIPCVIITSILVFTLISVHNEGGVVTFAVVYGFFSGTFVSLPPTVLIYLSMDNRALIGTRMGMAFAIASLGSLAGAPIAGRILTDKGFTSTWAFSGSMIIGAGCLMATSRFYKAKSLVAKV